MTNSCKWVFNLEKKWAKVKWKSNNFEICQCTVLPILFNDQEWRSEKNDETREPRQAHQWYQKLFKRRPQIVVFLSLIYRKIKELKFSEAKFNEFFPPPAKKTDKDNPFAALNWIFSMISTIFFFISNFRLLRSATVTNFAFSILTSFQISPYSLIINWLVFWTNSACFSF